MYTVCYVLSMHTSHHTGFWPFNSCTQLCKYLFRNVEQLYLLNATNNNHCAMKNYFVDFKEMFCNIRGYSLTLHSQHTFKKHFTLQFTYAKSQRPKIKDLGWYALNENVPIRMVIVALCICSMCHCAHSHVCIVDKNTKMFLFGIQHHPQKNPCKMNLEKTHEINSPCDANRW